MAVGSTWWDETLDVDEQIKQILHHTDGETKAVLSQIFSPNTNTNNICFTSFERIRI